MNALEIIKDLGGKISLTDVAACLPGLVLLAIWLLKTSLGRKALTGSPPRRNDMPVYLPFIPLFVGIGLVSLTIALKEVFLTDLADWQSAYFDNLILCIGAIAAAAVIVLLARTHFARRLKGFGLNPKTILKDFFAAVLNLISVYPLVTIALIGTLFLGKAIQGPDFELARHEQLKVMTEHSQLPVRILILFTTIAVMPVFEEMLFRGLFQTMIRSFLSGLGPRISDFVHRQSAWLAVAASACLFAAVHANAGHWPALFVLAVCMGYSYEKSGSLFRPIFIHSLFNSLSVIFTLHNS